MQFISPFNTEETARMAGRQALGPLIDAIRCTIADIVKDSEEAHAQLEPVDIDTILLVNIVVALDEHRYYRGNQAVRDWLFGPSGPHDIDELKAILIRLDELEIEVKENRGQIYDAFINLFDKLDGPDNTDTTDIDIDNTTKEARIKALERLITNAQIDLYKLRSDDDGGPDNE
jgi:hypothetical protein